MSTNTIKTTEAMRGITTDNELNNNQNSSTNYEPSTVIGQEFLRQKQINRYLEYMWSKNYVPDYNLTSKVTPYDIPEDYGSSRFDKRITSYSQLSDLDNFRAEQQGFFGELGASIANFTNTTASTFFNTVGLLPGVVLGTVKAVKNADKYKDEKAFNKVTGFLGEIVNNPLSSFINNLTEFANESYGTLYKTDEESNNHWYQNLFHHPWTLFASDIFPNLGFTAGAMYGGRAVSKLNSAIANLSIWDPIVNKNNKITAFLNNEATARLRMKQAGIVLDGASEQELNNVFSRIKTNPQATQALLNDLEKLVTRRNKRSLFTGLITGSLGEAQIEGLHAGQELHQSLTQSLERAWSSQDFQTALKQEYKATVDHMIFSGITNIPTFEEFAAQRRDEMMSDIEKSANQAAGLTTALQTALLTATNMTAWKSFFNPALTPEKAAMNEIQEILHVNTKPNAEGVRTVAGVTADKWTRGIGAKIAAKKAIVEGPVEEMGQSWITNAAQAGYGSGLFGDYKTLIDSEYQKESIDFLEATARGFMKSYGDPDAWIEGLTGSLFGIVGLPDLSIRSEAQRGKRKDGSSKLFGRDGAIAWNGWNWIGRDIKAEKNKYKTAEDLAGKFKRPEDGFNTVAVMKKVMNHMLATNLKEAGIDEGDLPEDMQKALHEDVISQEDIGKMAYGSAPLELLRNLVMMRGLSSQLDHMSSDNLTGREDLMYSLVKILYDTYDTIGCGDLFTGFFDFLKKADQLDLNDKNNPDVQFFNNVFSDETFTQLRNPSTGELITNQLSNSQKTKLIKSIAENARNLQSFLSQYERLKQSFTQILTYNYPNIKDTTKIAGSLAEFMTKADMEDAKIDKLGLEQFEQFANNNPKLKSILSKIKTAQQHILHAQNILKSDSKTDKYRFDLEELIDKLYDEISLTNNGDQYKNKEVFEKVVSDYLRRMKVDSMRGEVLTLLNSDKQDAIYKYFYPIEDAEEKKKTTNTINNIKAQINDYLTKNESANITSKDKVQYLLPLIDDIREVGGMSEVRELYDNTLEPDPNDPSNKRMRIKNGIDHAYVDALLDYININNTLRFLRSRTKKTVDRDSYTKSAIIQLYNKLKNTDIRYYQDLESSLYNEYVELLEKQKSEQLNKEEESLLRVLEDLQLIKSINNTIKYYTDTYGDKWLTDAVKSNEPFLYTRTFDYTKYQQVIEASNQYKEVSESQMPGGTIASNPTSNNTDNNTSQSDMQAVEDKIRQKVNDLGDSSIVVDDKIEVFDGTEIKGLFIKIFDLNDAAKPLLCTISIWDNVIWKVDGTDLNLTDVLNGNLKDPDLSELESFKNVINILNKISDEDDNANNNTNELSYSSQNIDLAQTEDNTTTYKVDGRLKQLLEALNKPIPTLDNLQPYIKELANSRGLTLTSSKPDDSFYVQFGIYKENGKYVFKCPSILDFKLLARYPIVFEIDDEVSLKYNNQIYKVKVNSVNSLGKIISASSINGSEPARYREGRFEVGTPIAQASQEYASKQVKFGSFPFSQFDYASKGDGNTMIQYRNASTDDTEATDKWKKSPNVSAFIKQKLSESYNDSTTSCAYSCVVDGLVKFNDSVTFNFINVDDDNINYDDINKFYGASYKFANNKKIVGIFKDNKLVGIVDPSNTDLLNAVDNNTKKTPLTATITGISNDRSSILTTQPHDLTDFKNDNYLVVYVDDKGNIYTNNDKKSITEEELKSYFNGSTSFNIEDAGNQNKFFIFPKTCYINNDNKNIIYHYSPFNTEITQKSYNEFSDKFKENLKTEITNLISTSTLDKQGVTSIFTTLKTLIHSDKGSFHINYNQGTSTDNDKIIISFQDKSGNTVDFVDSNGNTIKYNDSFELTGDNTDIIKTELIDYIIEALDTINPITGFNKKSPIEFFEYCKENNLLLTSLKLSYEHNIYFTYDGGLSKKQNENNTQQSVKTTTYNIGFNVNNNGKIYYNVDDLDNINEEKRISLISGAQFVNFLKTQQNIKPKTDDSGNKYYQITLIDRSDGSKKVSYVINESGEIQSNIEYKNLNSSDKNIVEEKSAKDFINLQTNQTTLNPPANSQATPGNAVQTQQPINNDILTQLANALVEAISRRIPQTQLINAQEVQKAVAAATGVDESTPAETTNNIANNKPDENINKVKKILDDVGVSDTDQCINDIKSGYILKTLKNKYSMELTQDVLNNVKQLLSPDQSTTIQNSCK